MCFLTVYNSIMTSREDLTSVDIDRAPFIVKIWFVITPNFSYFAIRSRDIVLVSYTFLEHYTEMRFILCTWLGEIYSCCCLTVLPGPAWVLLNKICKEYISSLYKVDYLYFCRLETLKCLNVYLICFMDRHFRLSACKMCIVHL